MGSDLRYLSKSNPSMYRSKPKRQPFQIINSIALKFVSALVFCLFVLYLFLFRQRPVDPPFNNSYQDDQVDKIWTPMSITECLPGMPEVYAPCLQNKSEKSNLIFAQEIVYRPFRLATPGFMNDDDKMEWMRQASNASDKFRISNDKSWAEYPTVYGQNLVFANARYEGNPPPDEWNENSGMGKSVSHAPFLQETSSIFGQDFKYLVIATAPSSWNYNQFQTRVLIMWNQAKLALSPSVMNQVTLLSGREPEEIVSEMYSMLDIPHVHYTPGASKKYSAKYLVFPSRTPLIHPYTTHSVSLSFGIKRYWKPLTDRKHILYFPSRNYQIDGNGNRSVINEAELLTAIEELLVERDEEEVLVEFKPENFKSIRDIIEYMGTNVRAVIGPHGRELFYARFAPADTIVIEFMTKDRFSLCFWELARLSGQNYYVNLLDPVDDHAMRIPDISSVIFILKHNLGQPPEMNNSVEPSYPWEIE